MDFELQWLLLALPVAFALGWLASRFDFRQWKREQREAPKAYFKGLGLLLNEQQDKAIDAFIEAVQQDPDTTDLHFALGNLFRRRGEYERAVRVHEHLLGRGDLTRDERERARYALAQDFLKAGLLDRAEEAYRALEGTAYDTESRLALLGLYERAHDWRAAIEVAQKLERSGTGSFATRMAHHWCELALEADAKQQADEAERALRQAREVAPQAPRPLVLAGQRAARQGRPRDALAHWNELLTAQPEAFGLVAGDYAALARAAGDTAAARTALEALYARAPTTDVLAALLALDDDADARRARLQRHLAEQPQLTAVQALARLQVDAGATTEPATLAAMLPAMTRTAKPLQRYRCAACGFEAQHHFWQCPGCLGWDTYPTLRLEDQ